MSFKRMLYFAAIIVGAVAAGICMPDGIAAYVITALFILLCTVIMYGAESGRNVDMGLEGVLAVMFLTGLIAEIFVFSWVLALVLFVFFGALAVNWLFW